VLVYFRTVALEEMYRLQRDSDHWDRIYVSELIIEAENRRPRRRAEQQQLADASRI